jgi:dihydrofolate reductase
VPTFVEDLSARFSKDIWLVGGAGLIAAFREDNLIDEYVLSVHPVLLGEGLLLFDGVQPREDLEFVGCKTYERGLVQLRYARA